MSDKLKFDPSQPFQAVGGKPRFDPSQPFDVAPPQPGTGTEQSLSDHMANMLTFGHLPQIEAAVNTGSLSGDDYLAARDAVSKRLNQEDSEHPIASFTGKAVGAVAPALAMPASAVSSIPRAMGIGAAMGAAQNPGDQEGVSDPLQLEARAKNAALGGVLGGAAEWGLPKIASGLSDAAQSAKEFANEKAAKILGHLSEFRNADEKGLVQPIGQMLRDEGMVGPLTSQSTLADRVASAKDAAGAQVGNLVKSAGDTPMIDTTDIAYRLANDPDLARISSIPGNEGLREKVGNQLETLAGNGKLSVADAQKLRQGIDANIKWARRADAPIVEQGLRNQRGAISDAMTDAVPGLQDANRRYQLLSTADDIADQQGVRNAQNRSIGLTDSIAGGAGAALGFGHGGPQGAAMGAALGAVGNKLGRSYGNAMMSSAGGVAEKLAGMSSGWADAAAKNPAGFNALASSIYSKMNPMNAGPQPATPGTPDYLRLLQQQPGLLNRIQSPDLKEAIQKHLDDEQNRGPAQETPEPLESAKSSWMNGG